MRLVRAVGLLLMGFVAGVAAAAATLKRALPDDTDPTSDELSVVAALEGVELRSEARALRGGSVLALLSGVRVDLRGASLAPGARLSLTSLLSGVTIEVPRGWSVEHAIEGLGAGVSVNVPQPDASDAPTLVVHGRALMSGVAVIARPPHEDA